VTATRDQDGNWIVISHGSVLAGPFATCSEAWRWIDRHSGEVTSKSEDTAEWSWNKRVHGE
jgi:hypothetical protein